MQRMKVCREEMELLECGHTPSPLTSITATLLLSDGSNKIFESEVAVMRPGITGAGAMLDAVAILCLKE